MTQKQSLTEIIKTHEEKLLNSSTRKKTKEINSLLDDSFREVGSSGKIYSKQEVIETLQSEKPFEYSLSDFTATSLSENVIHATYKIEIHRSDNPIKQKSLRSSIWKLSDERWRIVFHQGTRME